ncbi:MAG: hypothetical protein IIC02_06890 [Planctomycetes bacterium]|nr:hypothetical protein [Planctomycetota bacterium]
MNLKLPPSSGKTNAWLTDPELTWHKKFVSAFIAQKVSGPGGSKSACAAGCDTPNTAAAISGTMKSLRGGIVAPVSPR